MRQWNSDSHCQDWSALRPRSWDIRNLLEFVEPRFPPGFEPSVKHLNPLCNNIRSDEDGIPPKIDVHVEDGEFISHVPKRIRSVVFGCDRQQDYANNGDGDEIPPLRVGEEFTNDTDEPQVEITKCNFKGDDIEPPLRVTKGFMNDVQGAKLQVEITNCDDLIIKVEGDDKNISPATHEVPPIDDNHMAVDTIIPQVKSGTPRKVCESLSEDKVLVNANANSTPSSDVFNPRGNAETVKEIIEVWRQYTCA